MAEKKTRLFISYSREDKPKVEFLHEALSQDEELEVYLDTHNIEAGVEWESRLEDFIRSADSILFVLSPNSASSEVCHWEMKLADQLNKRIVPVVLKDVPNDAIPPTISKLNYIFYRRTEELKPALNSIGQALKIDIDWIREHTRIADLAHRWEQTRKLGAQPLRGKELDAAEKWLSDQPREAPVPTETQRKFIYESRKAATKRQRITVAGSFIAVVIVGILSIFAMGQRNAALEGEARALEGERKAEEALRSATRAANTLVSELAGEFFDKGLPVSLTDKILTKAIALQQRLLPEFPDDPDLLSSKAVGDFQVGRLCLNQNSLNQAEEHFRRSLQQFDSLFAKHGIKKYKKNAAIVHRELGEVYLRLGRLEDAVLSLNAAKIDATEVGDQKTAFAIVTDIANIYRKRGEFEKFERLLRQSISEIESLEISSVGPSWKQVSQSILFRRLGDELFDRREFGKALKHYKSSLELRSSAYPNDSETNEKELARKWLIYDRLAKTNIQLGSLEDAESYSKFSLSLSQKLLGLDSRDVQHLERHASSLENAGDIYAADQNFKLALQRFLEAEEIYDKSGSQSLETVSLKGSLQIKIADILKRSGNFDEARTKYRSGINLKMTVYQKLPNETNLINSLLRGYNQLMSVSQGDETKIVAIEVENFVNSIDNVSRNSTKTFIFGNLNSLFLFYMNIEEKKKAQRFLRQACDLSSKVIESGTHWFEGILTRYRCQVSKFKLTGKSSELLEALEVLQSADARRKSEHQKASIKKMFQHVNGLLEKQ